MLVANLGAIDIGAPVSTVGFEAHNQHEEKPMLVISEARYFAKETAVNKILMIAFDKGGASAGSQAELARISKDWAPGNNWQGTQNGVTLDVPSPTADNETLGQTIRRLGDDLYREIHQPGAAGPNRATLQECNDIQALYPEAAGWFNLAARTGAKDLAEHMDPISLMMAQLTSDPEMVATHPVGDINPRYANLVGDQVASSSLGGPQVGKFSSTSYSDNDE